jgi:hypothetical protein
MPERVTFGRGLKRDEAADPTARALSKARFIGRNSSNAQCLAGPAFLCFASVCYTTLDGLALDRLIQG